jgi:hypothetical protein
MPNQLREIMVGIKDVVLDALKLHPPYSFKLFMAIASLGDNYLVGLTGVVVDKNSETTGRKISP